MSAKYRDGTQTKSLVAMHVRQGTATAAAKALWLRNGTATVLVAVLAAPDQTPSAPSLSAVVNYKTAASWSGPTGDPGSWGRSTWKPHIYYRNASTLDPMADYVLAVGDTGDNRTWGVGYDGVQVQASLQWETDAGPGTRSAWSSAITISGGLG